MIPFALTLLNLFAAQASATCNPSCEPAVKVIQGKQNEEERVKLVLAKNEDYLKKNPTASPSVTVKIRSNILMSKLQIETLLNENTVLIAEAQKKGCQECLKPNQNTNGK